MTVSVSLHYRSSFTIYNTCDSIMIPILSLSVTESRCRCSVLAATVARWRMKLADLRIPSAILDLFVAPTYVTGVGRGQRFRWYLRCRTYRNLSALFFRRCVVKCRVARLKPVSGPEHKYACRSLCVDL